MFWLRRVFIMIKNYAAKKTSALYNTHLYLITIKVLEYTISELYKDIRNIFPLVNLTLWQHRYNTGHFMSVINALYLLLLMQTKHFRLSYRWNMSWLCQPLSEVTSSFSLSNIRILFRFGNIPLLLDTRHFQFMIHSLFWLSIGYKSKTIVTVG